MRVLRSNSNKSITTSGEAEGESSELKLLEAFTSHLKSEQKDQDCYFPKMFGIGSMALSSDSEELAEALPMFGLSELALGVADEDDNEDYEEDGGDADAAQPTKRKRIRHPPREPVICEVCSKQFTRKAHLVRHMYLHTGEKPFQCALCPQSFNRKDHLRSHMTGHAEAKPFKCSHCSCTFSRMDLLRVHTIKNHGKYQKTLKPVGGGGASGNSGKQSVSMPKLGFKVLTCRFCSMKFTQTQAYHSHLAAHRKSGTDGDVTTNDNDNDDESDDKNVERDLAEMHAEPAMSNDEEGDDNDNDKNGDEEEEADDDSNQQSEQDSQEEAYQQDGETGEDEENDLNQADDNSFGDQIDEPPRKLECVVCGKDSFSDQRALRRHYKVHKRKFVCRFCGVKMSSAGSLMRHNMLHTGEKPFKCNRCNRKFSRKDALKAHLVAHEKDSVKHTLPRPFVCTKCPASYTMRYNLIRHMRQCHQNQTRRQIPKLTAAPEQGGLKEDQPQQPIQLDPNNPLKCTHCDKVFSSMKSLSTHVWYHNQEKRFICKVCNRAFKYATDLNRHVMTHNTKIKQVSLTQQRAQNRLALARQQQQQQNQVVQRAPPTNNSIMVNGQRRYPCEYCTVIFNHRSNRSRHVRIFHKNIVANNQQGMTGNTAPQTQQRQQPAVQQQQQRQMMGVNNRMRRLVSNPGMALANYKKRIQPVSRNQLNLKANQAAALMRAQQQQMRQARISIESNDNDDVQPNYNGMYFKCDLCDKIFDKRYNYKLHLRTHNKQFSCIVCGLKTASQGDLTLHIRTHTGEKPFQCGFANCEWKFARRSALTVHYRRHHGPNAKIKRHYNPQRVTPNMTQVDSNATPQRQLGKPNNSILKTMLENYPCKTEPVEESDSQPPPQMQPAPKPKKNLPPPPPLIRYPLPPMLQKREEVKNGQADELTPEVVFLCRPCGQLISGKDNYVDHMLERHGTTVTAIGSTPVTKNLNPQQSKKSAPPTLLRRPTQQQQSLTCQMCGEMFVSRHDLTVHNLVSHSSESSQVMCGICRKLCSSIGFLSRHYQYCHPQVKNAAEEARTIMANSPPQHMGYDDHGSMENGSGGADSLLFPEVVIKEEEEEATTTTGDNEDSEGDLSFTPIDLLDTSMQLQSSPSHKSSNSNVAVDPNLPYPCPLCNKGFKDKKALADHKWYHSREPIYPCTVNGCGKRFKLKNDLIRHMRRHLQERPHACTATGCESRFYQKSDMVRHLSKVHNQVETLSYACQHCSTGFNKPDLLVRHMKSSHPGQDISHLLVLQMLDHKKKEEEKQMQEFLANLPPEEEEEVVDQEPEWSQDHDLDYSFELQQLEIDAFDNEDDLAYRQSLNPTQRHKNAGNLQVSPGQSKMMEKLATEQGDLDNGPPFTCQTCNKVYDDRQKFIYHRYYHLREFRYTCPEEGCGEKFKIKGHVERHIRTYHNSEKPVKNILRCPEAGCTRKFTRDYDLSNHLEKVHSTSPNASGYDEMVQGMLEFDNTNNMQEEEEEEAATEEMEQKYWDESVEERHLEERTSSPSTSLLQPCMNKLEEYTNEAGELYCKACNKHFKDLKTLQNHVYYHQRESKHHCEECGAKFKQRSDLRRHISIHHDPNNKRKCIPCPQCNRSFTHERYLRIHLNKECDGILKEEGEDPLEQEDDEHEEIFSMNPQVQIDMEEVLEEGHDEQQQQEDSKQEGEIWEGEEQEPPNPLMFVASNLQGDEEEDNGTFNEDYNEEDEEEDEGYDKGHHTQQQQPIFECDLCDSFFSRSNELILHKRSVHGGTQKNSPPPQSSSSKGKSKTFTCNKCGSSFLQKGELTQHLQQYHLDELPIHQCQFCPKYFYVKKSLDTHRRRHHSHLLNLIACQVCGMKFQAREYLVSHMKSHHQ